MEDNNPKTMTDAEAKAFVDDLLKHAEKSASTYFALAEADDESLARGPSNGFNEFLREKGMNWMHFERDDSNFAHYCSDQHKWFEGYTYRKLLVRRYREAL